jgi:hypothetical protein
MIPKAGALPSVEPAKPTYAFQHASDPRDSALNLTRNSADTRGIR